MTMIIIIITIIITIEFLTSQLWLGNIHLSWDVVINRIRLGGLICSLKSFLQLLLLLLLTAIGLPPGGSGYFTCIQNIKLVTNKFKSRGLREKHVVATWNLGNHLSICL